MGRFSGGSVYKIASIPIRLRCLFLLATIFVATFLFLTIRNITDIKSEFITTSWSHDKGYGSFTENDYTIKTKGCVIPSLEPFGDEVKQFAKYPKDFKPCPGPELSLLGNNRTHIWVRNDNKEYYNIINGTPLNCCYTSFFRPLSVDDITSSNIDNRVKYSECKYFSDMIKATDEFVRVSCYVYYTIVYQQYFLFTFKKEVANESNDFSRNKTAYNVIVMGIDAVSRLNFHRTMPETLSVLNQKGAIELLGYNKVGDNTFPNLIPMLMGISENELKTTCIPNKKSTFDNCPFIWEWYREAGYYTAFGEDSSSLGTFNYEKGGFIKTPTDYYIHTFMNEAEHNVGVNKDVNSFLCMNEKYFYTVLLDYIENLTLTLTANNFFGFFWEVTISHDYVNYPMLIDKDYADFFKKLDSSNYLDETIIFLVSDHGIRWGEIRSTNQGRLEERLPFVYILTPPNFRKKYKNAFENLNVNSRRLTTPYDLHATLYDLMNLEIIEDKMIDLRRNQSNLESKGISLFLPISVNRTCAAAHIDDHWCSCHKGHHLPTNNKQSLDIAQKLVQELNKLLKSYSQCALLKLAELLEITALEISLPENDEIEWREYMVVIKTMPGDGLFEGTLRHDGHDNWSVIGTVSRFNLYGNQSRCIHDYLLKLYCYCI
ncbi:uncharacterized protein LOC125077258 [Vanessa atalanta]|uniref:uncharacterized protein LOC125077258 n=1 Tax=Vanessa atalanta TaxID=42275 RepID=UPI001FCD55C9|nr:uncharacterized protein LOC125077258 [Vanessa atalanta]